MYEYKREIELKLLRLIFWVEIIFSIFIVFTSSGSTPIDEVIRKFDSIEIVSVVEAEHLIENTSNLFILDVRSLSEYNEGHLIGANLIPLNELLERQSELPSNMSTPILVYCRTGVRSAIASSNLMSLGYNTIFNMEGGFEEWLAHGFQFTALATSTDTLISTSQSTEYPELFLILLILGIYAMIIYKHKYE